MVLALIGLTISHVGCGRVLSYCAHATAHMQLNETAKWKKKIVERLSRTQTVAGPRVPGKEVETRTFTWEYRSCMDSPYI